MSVPETVRMAGIPAAGTVRRMVRTARAARAARTWRQRVGDGYEIVLTVVILGGIGVEAGRRAFAFADSGAVPANARAVGWLLVAMTVLLSGLAVRGLAAIGPLVAGPATQTWLLATPVDRADLLAARHRWTLVAGLGVGAGYGVLLGVLGRSELGLCIGIGGLLGLALAGWAVRRQSGQAVLRQGGQAARWQGGQAGWLRPVASAAVVAGLLLGLVVAGLKLSGREPPGVPGWVLAVGMAGAAIMAGAGVVGGRRTRGGISRAALSEGAGLAGASVAAVQWFDPTLLSGLLTQRHWLRVASVRSRRLRARSRTGALLAAERRRLSRSRQALLAGGALLVVCYALAAVISPVWTPVVQLVGATLAADRLAGGLRAVCRSPALRRALGGSDQRLRLAHLGLPAGGALVWSALSLPVVWADGPLLGILYPAMAATAVVFRVASRPQVDYNLAATVDPAVNVLPIGLLTQLARGPMLLLGLAAVRVLLGV